MGILKLTLQALRIQLPMKVAQYVIFAIALLALWIPLALKTGAPRLSLVIAGTFLGGLFSFFASLFNWEFFFNNHSVADYVERFGRKKVRAFYGVLGCLMLTIGLVGMVLLMAL